MGAHDSPSVLRLVKATLEGGLSYRNGLALDASGNVYVANAGHTTASTKILLATDTTVDLPPGAPCRE